MLVMLLYCASFAVGSIMGVVYGYDPIAAVLESVSCTANCGISSGIINASLPLGLKICYFVQMLAGRLEFLTLLATFAGIGSSIVRGTVESRAARSLVAAMPSSVRRAWRGKSGRVDR